MYYFRAMSLIAAVAICGYAQKTVPTSAEVIQLAKKALGGKSFFDPKPYSLTRFANIDNQNGSKRELKTSNYSVHYKNYKSHYSGNIGRFTYTYIMDIKNYRAWDSVDGGEFNEQKRISLTREIPFLNEPPLNSLLFVSKIPAIVKENGIDYYKVEAKYRNGDYEDRRTYLIDVKTYLIYKNEIIQNSGVKAVYTYTNYTRVGEIMVPQNKTQEITSGGQKSFEEITISNFKFRDDIPDTLFEVPKK